MAVAVAALFAACGGFALAATTVGPVIRACADKKSGALRLGTKCGRGESSVSWNRVGPQGKRGATGLQGPQGAEGPAGTAGAAGPQGPAGTARAYATMRPDECFHANSECTIYNVKNVASIRRVSTGTYCVAPAAGLAFDDVTPALTTDAFNSGPTNGFGVPVVAYSSLKGPCGSSEIKVQTYRATGSTPTVALSNNTSFGIVIP
jgi:hypothetical protein